MVNQINVTMLIDITCERMPKTDYKKTNHFDILYIIIIMFRSTYP